MESKPFIRVPNSLIQWSNIDESKSLLLPLYLYSAQNAQPSTQFHIITSPATIQASFNLTSNQSRLSKNLRSSFNLLSQTIPGVSFDHATNSSIKISIPDTTPVITSLTSITPTKGFEYTFLPKNNEDLSWTPITYEKYADLISALRSSSLDPVKGINLYMTYLQLINHYKTYANFSMQYMQDLTSTSYHTLKKYLDFFVTNHLLIPINAPDHSKGQSIQYKI